MNNLLLDSSIAQLELALHETISLGLKARLPPVANVPALRAVRPLGASGGPARTEGDPVYVASKENVYRWSQASSAVDDEDGVIKPEDSKGTGRWLKAVSSVLFGGVNVGSIPTGILKAVVLHNGDFSQETLQARVYGQAPCVAIHFAGEEHTPLSQIPGALYNYTCRFELWSVSRNYREGPEAALGSSVAGDAGDPGVMKIHGAVKKLLAGQDLGQPGVKYIEIGQGRLEQADECERLFVMSLGIEVRGSIHNSDALSELARLQSVTIEKSFDASDEAFGGPDQVTF